MSILVTGAAGFIGYHTTQALLALGHQVIGIDSLNSYYDPALKKARLKLLEQHPQFHFRICDIADVKSLNMLPGLKDITHIIHLAAQAGVRHSLHAPFDYASSNLVGQLSILELARYSPKLEHLVYASSSSVYGANHSLPFRVEDRTDSPVSLYAATKKSAEMLSYSYSHLYGIKATGLRFFTVYGAWGRPDMAYFHFTRDILAGKPITLFNEGDMRRDFTYIDDIVAGILAVMDKPSSATPPHRIYNLGNSKSETLGDFIAALETALGKKAVLNYAPMQPGDMKDTYADITASTRDFGFLPKTSIAEGLPGFVEWYRSYY